MCDDPAVAEGVELSDLLDEQSTDGDDAGGGASCSSGPADQEETVVQETLSSPSAAGQQGGRRLPAGGGSSPCSPTGGASPQLPKKSASKEKLDKMSYARLTQRSRAAILERKHILFFATTKFAAVRELFASLPTWQQAETLDARPDLIWFDSWHEEQFADLQLQAFQRFNHFPGMSCIYRKCSLAKNLNKLRRALGDVYSFFPESWVLPQELADFKAQAAAAGAERATYILKPDQGCQGNGILLLQDANKLPSEYARIACVAQRYVAQPMLLDGHKFDIRFHVLVTGCDPLRVFIHRSAVVRLAAEPYCEPKGNNLKEKAMHITNAQANCHNENYKPDDAVSGHRRSWETVVYHLAFAGLDMLRVESEIDDLVVKTLIAAQPNLALAYSLANPGDVENTSYFEILGFDVMLDERGKPWLLEVNHMPSFRSGTEVDAEAKRSALEDAIKLLDISPKSRQRLCRRSEKKTLAVQGTLTEELRAARENAAQQRTEWERENCGGYRMLCPAAAADEQHHVTYASCLEAAAAIALGHSSVKASASVKSSTLRRPLRGTLRDGLATSPVADKDLSHVSERQKSLFQRLSQPRRVSTPPTSFEASRGGRERHAPWLDRLDAAYAPKRSTIGYVREPESVGKRDFSEVSAAHVKAMISTARSLPAFVTTPSHLRNKYSQDWMRPVPRLVVRGDLPSVTLAQDLGKRPTYIGRGSCSPVEDLLSSLRVSGAGADISGCAALTPKRAASGF
eukprot:TRINITY_DN24391_c0_g1_i1.p1 TRINITY_DN24391_c0_g1~~TRINITY_DN24391_c0_g1_i1.p1  ORF type:complete len:742 (-),score=181.39 TRINITY_DN24391_c0_g1_i1:178-2403(-)